MKVKIKLINDNAIIPFKTHKEDFCYDVTAISEEQVAPNVWKYGIGIAFQIDRWDEYTAAIGNGNISIDLRPRSSIWKTGMVLSNSTGTVDEIFTGEVSAVFYHVMPDMPRYKIGDRIGQIKLGFTSPMEFIEVDQLLETSRNSGSYGSTDF